MILDPVIPKKRNLIYQGTQILVMTLLMAMISTVIPHLPAILSLFTKSVTIKENPEQSLKTPNVWTGNPNLSVSQKGFPLKFTTSATTEEKQLPLMKAFHVSPTKEPSY